MRALVSASLAALRAMDLVRAAASAALNWMSASARCRFCCAASSLCAVRAASSFCACAGGSVGVVVVVVSHRRRVDARVNGRGGREGERTADETTNANAGAG